ncbi:MAG: cupin domain-containing protein [Myxococcales bacterium]|nr:cupin domain-containing protein [Myxococcales bacterium]
MASRSAPSGTPVDREQVERDWKARGFSRGLFTDPPGRCWEDYVHSVDELLMVLEGEVEIEISGVARIARPGEEIFIPARALHSVRNRGRTTSRWLYGYKEG